MSKKDVNNFLGIVTLASPFIGWIAAAKHYHLAEETHPKIKGLMNLVPHTTEHLPLMLMPAGFAIISIAAWYVIARLSKQAFTGAEFKEHLRGTEVVTESELARKTKSKKKEEQIFFGNIPVPCNVENLMTLLAGTTGTGKSVVMRRIAFTLLKRGNRMVVADNNGDLYSKFGRPNDIILNPFDARTRGWNFYNEIRKDYDFDRMARAIVPIGEDKASEEWRSYARLLLSESAKRLHSMGDYTIHALHQLTTVAEPDELRGFLVGTPAESLFVEGAERALGSARFVLSKYLPAHLLMPDGDFSLRDWLEDPDAGNLYITWREDMKETIKPLISCFHEIIYSSLLSLPEDKNRILFSLLDELASLDSLSSLEDALTKGRKSGLRIVAGLQATAQLDHIYGATKAKIIRSCFRNLVVLGIADTDPETAEIMSKALGTHDVIRDKDSTTHSMKGSSSSNSDDVKNDERVVLPSELTKLPERTGYIKFAGDYPIAKVEFPFDEFESINNPFVEI